MSVITNKKSKVVPMDKNPRLSRETLSALRCATAVMALGMMAIPITTQAQDATPLNSWDYDTVIGGNVSKDTSIAGTTDITVTGGNGHVQGNADIYAGHTVNVIGDNASATFAYEDNRANIESTLSGDLNSNMNIVIIDKDGVFFTENSRIDVHGILATSGDIAHADIMGGGALNITNIAEGGDIINNGTITVAESGMAALVAPHVVNNGVINAGVGKVTLAAAQMATVDFRGDGFIEFAVQGELANALVENNGTINAEGGTVRMTALAAKDTLDSVVNNTGIINASSVTVAGGKIILDGGDKGTVRNDGTIVTSEGGQVDINGERFVQGLGAVSDFDRVPPLKPVKINSGNGDINIATSGNVEVYAGTIEGGRGDTTIDNDGVFYSAQSNTLVNYGGGNITLNQNKDTNIALNEEPVFEGDENQEFFESATIMPVGPSASIQNAIDAVNNGGNGINTINVGVGTFSEDVKVDHQNLVLLGAQAGVHAGDLSRGTGETVINAVDTGFFVTADNAVIDGFEIFSKTGVSVKDVRDAKLHNTRITADETGIAFGDFSRVVDVRGNAVLSSLDAVRFNALVDFDLVTVEDNDLSADRDGVAFKNGVAGGRTLVAHNNIDAGSNGVVFDAADNGVSITELARINVEGNNIDAGNVGVRIDHGMSGGSIINIGNQGAGNVIASGNDGVRFRGDVVGSRIRMNSNDITAGRDGVDIERIGEDSVVAIFDNDKIEAQNGSAVFVSAIDSAPSVQSEEQEAAPFTETASGGLVIANNENLVGTRDGVTIGDVTGSSVAIVDNDTITGGNNGVRFGGNVDSSRILIGDEVTDENESAIIGDGANGIIFAQDVTDSDILLGEGDITTRSLAATTSYTTTSQRGVIVTGAVDGIDFDADVVGTTITVDDSNVTGKSGNAVHFEQRIEASDVVVSNNTLLGGRDGVSANGTLDQSSLTVELNDIEGQSGHGVEVTGLIDDSDVFVYDNTRVNGYSDGVHVRAELSGATVIDVLGNEDVIGANGDGVQITNDATGSSPGTVIIVESNEIGFSKDNGMELDGLDNVDVFDNEIFNSGDNGIDIRNSRNVLIEGSEIRRSGEDAVYADNISNVSLIDNRIRIAADDGIDVRTSDNVNIDDNNLRFINGDDGISSVFNTGDVIITENFVDEIADDAVYVLSENILGETGGEGTSGFLNNSVTISNNLLINAGGDGIDVRDVADLSVGGNTIRDNFEHGLKVGQGNNGNIRLTSSVFTNNGHLSGSAQARFESGDIDVSDVNASNTFTNTSGVPATAMQFDNVGDGTGTGLRIVNETLGSTVFDGYTDVGSFYTRFEDGAILETVTNAPILIDAANVSFDGVVPNTFPGGQLPAATLGFIEERLFDADDAVIDGRGQIFVGEEIVPVTGAVDNFQDFIQDQGTQQEQSSAGSVTIQSLPSIDGFNAQPVNLAGIEPAAGNDSAQNPADIEPAAGGGAQASGQGGNQGGQDVTCLDDAYDALDSGSVTYNFGGSFEESISNASACGTNVAGL